LEAQESKPKVDQPRIVEQIENPLTAMFEAKLRKFCLLKKADQIEQISKLSNEMYETMLAPLVSQVVFRYEAIRRLTDLMGRVITHLRSWADHRRKGWNEALHVITEVQKTIASWNKKKVKNEKLKRSVGKKTSKQNKGSDISPSKVIN